MEEEGPPGVFPGWARLRHDPQLDDDDTADWTEVDTPPIFQSSKPVRLKQFGPRLFIVLDSEAIPPLAELMSSKNRWNRQPRQTIQAGRQKSQDMEVDVVEAGEFQTFVSRCRRRGCRGRSAGFHGQA